jgi:hypothetical protein
MPSTPSSEIPRQQIARSEKEGSTINATSVVVILYSEIPSQTSQISTILGACQPDRGVQHFDNPQRYRSRLDAGAASVKVRRPSTERGA